MIIVSNIKTNKAQRDQNLIIDGFLLTVVEIYPYNTGAGK